MRFSKFSLAGFLIIFLLSPAIYAGGPDPMYNFYDGLTDIIERNMNNPDKCVSQAERFIKSNIEPLQQAMERGKRQAQNSQHRHISEEEMRQATESVMKSRGFQAVKRFMEVFNGFTMKHPEHARQISDILSEFGSQFEEY